MEYENLISPKEVRIGERTFCVSKIPALSAIPIRNGIAALIKEHGALGLVMFGAQLTKDVLQYAAIQRDDGSWQTFMTDKRINEAFPDQKDLQALVAEMVKENFGFFVDGTLPSLLGLAVEE